MTCPRCAAPLPPDSLFCNRCGTKTTPSEAPPPANSGRWLVIVAGAVLVTGVMGAVLASGSLDGYISALDNEKPYTPPPPAPSSGPAPQPASSPRPQSPPSSGPAAPLIPPNSTAFTVNLDSTPQGATITDQDGAAIGQTPTSVVLPTTTIVEFTLSGFSDTCRFELSSKLKNQTIKCTFRKPSPGGNPDSLKPTVTPPSSAPTPKKPANNDAAPNNKPPPSNPPKKKPSSNPTH
jgi:hypothetical protein